jgi:hypothetical protein
LFFFNLLVYFCLYRRNNDKQSQSIASESDKQGRERSRLFTFKPTNYNIYWKCPDRKARGTQQAHSLLQQKLQDATLQDWSIKFQVADTRKVVSFPRASKYKLLGLKQDKTITIYALLRHRDYDRYLTKLRGMTKGEIKRMYK